MEDRPGVRVPEDVIDPSQFVISPSVFETYQQREAPLDEVNLMYLGRRGTGEFINTNYLELAVNRNSTYENSGNGQIGMRFYKDGELQNSAVALYDLSTVLSGTDGVNALVSSERAGGSMLAHFDSSNVMDKVFYIGGDGIILLGLPTSNPGVAGALYTSTITFGEGEEQVSYSGVLRVSSG